MAVPKKKKSKSRSGNQASHDALVAKILSYDSNGNICLSHRATKLPGGGHMYKGKMVIPPKVKKAEEAN